MGLLEIGYHLIIDRDGCIHRIRNVLSVGSHTPAYNHISIGVCLIGGKGANGQAQNNFEPMQTRSLAWVMGGFRREWPRADIFGHNELGGYRRPDRHACPAMSMAAVRAWETDAEGPKLSTMIEGPWLYSEERASGSWPQVRNDEPLTDLEVTHDN